jgi:hypothetical protein
MTLGNATRIPLRPIDLCVATLSVFQKREFKGKTNQIKIQLNCPGQTRTTRIGSDI